MSRLWPYSLLAHRVKKGPIEYLAKNVRWNLSRQLYSLYLSIEQLPQSIIHHSACMSSIANHVYLPGQSIMCVLSCCSMLYALHVRTVLHLSEDDERAAGIFVFLLLLVGW